MVITVTVTITKKITSPSGPTHPSAGIAAVISAVSTAVDLRALYADLGEDTTVIFEASEE